MKKRTLQTIAFAINLLPLLLFFAGPAAIAQTPIADTINRVADRTDLPVTDEQTVLMSFLLWTLAILTILAVISFVVYGIMFIFAGVDKNAADKARQGVIYSIIGVAVALAAYVIINLVSDIMYDSAVVGD